MYKIKKCLQSKRKMGCKCPLKPSIFILCLSVSLNPNVKMAKRIRPKICVGPQMTTGKGLKNLP